jgi:hypothetical protein
MITLPVAPPALLADPIAIGCHVTIVAGPPVT